MSEVPDPECCETHRTPLTVDAIRGMICPICDAERVADVRNLWARFTAWVIRLATFDA